MGGRLVARGLLTGDESQRTAARVYMLIVRGYRIEECKAMDTETACMTQYEINKQIKYFSKCSKATRTQ